MTGNITFDRPRARTLDDRALDDRTLDDRTLDDEARWRIVRARDRRYDGVFVMGVHSTGIYCRPSCPARTPRRANVRFYRDGAAARAAGLRACQRCAPDDQSREERAIARVIEILRHSDSAPSLAALSRPLGYSPAHFQRLFKRAVGLSPAALYRALREQKVRAALAEGHSVTEAIYQAGYGASSRFYEGMKGKLGMEPSDWTKGGEGRTIHYCVMETSFAPMLVAATDKGVCCLAFGEGEAELRKRFPRADLVKAGEEMRALFEKVLRAVEDPASDHAHIPLDIRGTAFQQRVWQELRKIPPGETRSYGELAAAIGKPRASRAVGGANGANHIAVLIPCHRVIASDGSLGGYAYGLKIKQELLRREARDLQTSRNIVR